VTLVPFADGQRFASAALEDCVVGCVATLLDVLEGAAPCEMTETEAPLDRTYVVSLPAPPHDCIELPEQVIEQSVPNATLAPELK